MFGWNGLTPRSLRLSRLRTGQSHHDFCIMEECRWFARRVKLPCPPAAAGYFAWGCFRYFGSAPPATAGYRIRL